MGEQTGYEIDTSTMKFAAPSRILTRAMDSAALLTIAKNSRAFDPAIFDETPPFFFPCEMSNKNLDSYYTRMDESSLKNFAADAQAGIALQDSHDTCRMGLGVSLTGNYDGQRTTADFLVMPGIGFNGGSYENSDDFIKHIRSGVARDTSVRFCFTNTDPSIFSGVRCDICGENLYRWDCPHIPGLTYDMTDEARTITRMICTGTVLNAHACEQSVVYDGSTPGAAILKARAEAALGRLTPKEARFLEDRYRSQNLKLADVKQIFALGATGERTMEPNKPTDEVKRHPDDVAQANNIRGLLTKAGFAENQDPLVAIAAMTDELGTLRKLKDDQPTLEARAKDGDLYRKSLIDEVVREGVRAFGTDYDEESERKLLATAELETVKKRAAQNKLAGDKLFPGGRATTDGEDIAIPARRAEPVSAYRV